MKIKLKENLQNIQWHDLDYGDVFRYNYSDETNDVVLGMKVYEDGEGDKILDLETFALYTDVYKYDIVEVLDCTLVENYNE